MRSAAGWEHFEHGADIGVRGRGASLAEAFAQAALAMTAVVTDPEHVAPKTAVVIHCEAPNKELLLADWLNAIIYEMAVRKMLFREFEVDIEDHRLRATLRGEPVSRDKHHPAVEVKGATYTDLCVYRDAEGHWIAQCVVDV